MANRPGTLGAPSLEEWMRAQKRQDRKLALATRQAKRDEYSRRSQRAIRRTMEEFDEAGYA